MSNRASFRPIREGDIPFLRRVYAGTRAEELALLDWDETEKEEFLLMQFNAQHQYYQQQFDKASFDIILLNEQPIGRLYVDRREDEIRIIDIALLPEFRRRGIGGSILRDLLVEATEAGLPVRIHVEKNNPALSLYGRLGFTPVGDTGVYYLMEHVPQAES